MMNDDVAQKRLQVEKPRFELATKGVFRLGTCYRYIPRYIPSKKWYQVSCLEQPPSTLLRQRHYL